MAESEQIRDCAGLTLVKFLPKTPVKYQTENSGFCYQVKSFGFTADELMEVNTFKKYAYRMSVGITPLHLFDNI